VSGEESSDDNAMRILLLNWRDIRSPKGGGAERVTHDVARALVARGHAVTWLSSSAPGLSSDELIDGVHVLRRGSEATTRLHAPSIAYRLDPQVVLEEINTLPYLAPVWSRVPVLLYMNQLAREVWWYEAPLPVAAAGWLAEPLYLKAYRNCDAVTISRSSRDDLRRVGIQGAISIAPMTADIERAAALGEKRRTGTLVVVGRLTPSKRYDHAIAALVELRRDLPEATLTLVGDGRSRESLQAFAQRLGVEDAVRFVGKIPEAEKASLLEQADVLVGTSVREGWGLTVTEAAARGTPSVVYDIPGFRDSVLHERTGLLVDATPFALAEGVRRLLSDAEFYDRLRRAAWEMSESPRSDAAVNAFERSLMDTIGRGRS
jgi:glycosyltransferase involved in cell wall biosynthesis